MGLALLSQQRLQTTLAQQLMMMRQLQQQQQQRRWEKSLMQKMVCHHSWQQRLRKSWQRQLLQQQRRLKKSLMQQMVRKSWQHTCKVRRHAADESAAGHVMEWRPAAVDSNVCYLLPGLLRCGLIQSALKVYE
jgi:hypothetical protein